MPVGQRPGFLIRRLHQRHSALFVAELGAAAVLEGAGLTPVMYSVLSALAQKGPLDQSSLARLVAIDKANIAEILERLGRRGLVERDRDPADRRVRLCELTAAGLALLDRLDEPAARAHARTLEGLDADEQAHLLALVERVLADRE